MASLLDNTGSSVRVEAENYVAFSDTSGGNAGDSTLRSDDVDIYTTADASGHAVGGLRNGEWLEYDIELPQTGEYIIVVRAASPRTVGQSLDITLGGQTFNVPIVRTGGWQVWQDFTLSGVSLTGGAQTLRLDINQNRFQINYIDFIPVGTGDPPPDDTPESSPGVIGFDADSYTVAEDGASASVIVERTNGSDGEVSATVNFSGDTATAGSDFDGTSQVVTFAEGETRRAIAIPITDDTVQEGNETVNLELSNGTGGATIGSQSTAVLTIVDNDTTTPDLGSPIRVEGEDYTTFFDTRRGNSGGVFRDDDVDLFTSSDASGIVVGSIREGEFLEFDVALPGTEGGFGTFDAVVRVASPRNVAHSIDLDIGGETHTFNFGRTGSSFEAYTDIVLENLTLPTGAQSFHLTFNSRRFNFNYIEFIPTEAPAPAPGEIALDSTFFTVDEDAGTASITLNRTGGESGEVSVDLDFVNGGAVGSIDFLDTAPTTVTFGDGVTTRTVTVPIVNDTLDEGDETINVLLGNAAGGATLGNQDTATLTIQDDDSTPGSPRALRILPLGDSITFGFGTDVEGDGILENEGGYRIRLEDLLANNNIDVDFVGSETGGPDNLTDQDNEGHPGFRIDEIASKIIAENSIANADPDVVLLLLGTNDINQNYELATAPDRLNTLIDQVLTDAPDSHVIVSTIPTTARGSLNVNVDAYNAAIPGIVNAKVAEGQSVSLVDINSVISTNELADSLHPTLQGYNDAAAVWFEGLLNQLDTYGDYTATNNDLFVNAALTATTPRSTTIQADLVNNSGVVQDDLSLRYFVDLTELIDAGHASNDVLVGNISGPTVGELTLWDAQSDVYYVDVDFSGTAIAPNTSATVEFSLGIDSLLPSSAWDQGNDWSAQGLTAGLDQSRYVPVYDSGSLISGVVPA